VTEPVLAVDDLAVHFPLKTNAVVAAGRTILRWAGRGSADDRIARPRVHAVDGVTFRVDAGEIVGLVGESGCGKTTTGRAVLRLVEPTRGRIVFEGRDITHLREPELRPIRPRIQIVFQDPHAALNPAMTIGQSIQDGILLHVTQDIREATDASLQVMAEVGLTPPEDLFGKYPADLSGGQKQRAVLARALALRPSLIVADEPVAMLDMSIRARILELLLSLRRRHGLAILFITHDLATAKFVCDRIAIMYLGRIVETGPSEAIFQDPKHPYTRALIGAIPVPEPGHRRERTLPHGEVPDAIVPPAGCRFHPRCPVALASCGWEARDFLAYLEDRRLRSSDPEAAEEVLGSVEDWYADGRTARTSVPAENARAVARRVGGLLEEAPPAMAAAVSDVFVRGNEVLVRFREPDVLTPKTVDGREVECLLY
jgi:peptide/nickel transport system ATP-binding protein